MNNNKDNQQVQNQTTDQSVTNNTGDNAQNINAQQQTNNQNDGSQQQNNQNTGGTGANGKTFTQEDVNRMMTAEKNQGRANAFREMGIDPNDPNAQNMMNMFKSFITSMQTPEQQEQSRLAQQQIKLAEAESRAKKAEAKAEAMQNGLLPQYVDDAVIIVMSKLDDGTDVKTIIGELKTKYPVWFGDSNVSGSSGQQNEKDGQNNKGTGSSIGNVGGNGSQNDKVTGIGARLAAQRKDSSKKSSFWD